MAVPGKKAQKQFSGSVSLASDEDLKVYCIPCERAGPRLPAFGFCQDCNEHLCQNCFNHHKKATLSMNHVLLDKGTMPKSLQSSWASTNVRKPDDLKSLCLKHKKKKQKFYCKDHKVLLCSVCVTLEHTGKSCHVDYIPDISGNVVDSKELKDTLEYMDIIIQHCQKVKKECKKATEKSLTSLTEVLKEIKKYRQEINKRIDELEREVENQAKILQQRGTQRLQTTDTICDDVTKSLKTLADNIRQSNRSKQANKLFIELKTAEIEMKEHETCINELTTGDDDKAYTFKSNLSITTALQNESSLGTLEQKVIFTPVKKLDLQKPQNGHASEPKKLSASDKMNKFCFQYKINVKTADDSKGCWITVMTLLNKDQLVVADFINRSVKMVDVNRKTVRSSIKMSSAPWDITSVSNDQLAVTLPHVQKIQFLSVKAHTLSQTHSLKVDGDCHGISYYNNKLAVSYVSFRQLEILDMKGRVLISVTTDANGEKIFSAPWFVQANSHSIYVSDNRKGTLTILSWQGQVTCSYGDLADCQGLAVSADGRVFVSERGNNSITEISGDCRHGKIVINEINKPQTLSFDNSQRLYISSTTFTDDDNFINLFSKA